MELGEWMSRREEGLKLQEEFDLVVAALTIDCEGVECDECAFNVGKNIFTCTRKRAMGSIWGARGYDRGGSSAWKVRD